MGIQAGKSGSCCPALCVFLFLNLQERLRLLLVLLLVIREVTLSDTVCFTIQLLHSALTDFIQMHALCRIVCAVSLSLRDDAAVCLQTVGIACEFTHRLDVPRAQCQGKYTLLHTGDVPALLQVFSSTVVHFCPVYLHLVHASGDEYFRYSEWYL